jgi:hypothetical protein|tara:strand:+ start:643 stop:834 length:192 start_codon:yes stop_codon:yes gene_type:complete
MNKIKENWKKIVMNPRIFNTSFGSISYLPPVQNNDNNFIHPPLSISKTGLAQFNQFCEGKKDE